MLREDSGCEHAQGSGVRASLCEPADRCPPPQYGAHPHTNSRRGLGARALRPEEIGKWLKGSGRRREPERSACEVGGERERGRERGGASPTIYKRGRVLVGGLPLTGGFSLLWVSTGKSATAFDH